MLDCRAAPRSQGVVWQRRPVGMSGRGWRPGGAVTQEEPMTVDAVEVMEEIVTEEPMRNHNLT